MSKDNPRQENGVEEGLPPEIRDFLREAIQGRLMQLDILSFFHHNPYAILTVSDLSTWVSREERPLGEALQRLAAEGYLSQSPASSAFVLTRDRQKRGRVEQFFSYLDDHPETASKLRAELRRRLEAE